MDDTQPVMPSRLTALGDDETAFVLGGRGGLRRRAEGAIGTWLGVAVVLAVVAMPLRGLYRFTGGTMEEGFMLYYPELLRHGEIPNLDFIHLYGPGSLQALLGWYERFGFSLPAERTFGLLQHLGIIFGLFVLARPWGRLAATVVASLAVFYVLTPVGLTAMAWNGGLALTLWSAVLVLRGVHLAEPRRRRRAWLIAGVLAGLALTFRPDLIVAVALVLGWLLWRQRASRGPVAIGAVIGLVPMWVHLAMAGPGDAVRGMIIDPVFHLRAGRELPRPPSWRHLDGALQAVAEEIPPWWRVPHLQASHALFLWFCLMVVGTFALLAFAIWLRRGTGHTTSRSTVLLAVALISVGILPQALQRPDSAHLSWVTCISWPFAVVAVADAVRRWRPQLNARAALGAGTAVTLALTLTFTALFTFRYYLLHVRVGLGQVPSAFPVERDGRRFYLGDHDAYLAVSAAVDDLAARAKPGERLLVGPLDLRRTWYSDAFIYWLFPELRPATYYIEMDPGLANAPHSSLARDVASADWVVLTGLWAGWQEPNAAMKFGPDAPNQAIRDHFCQVGSYQEGLVVLYHRCR